MKADRYAVSVQWGGGFHYFIKYFPVKEMAVHFAQEWIRTEKPRKRGAKPIIHVWYMVDTFAKKE